ncbi:MAG: hypothetical protein HYR64_05165 [Fimbriimonas ginsengisoli]|uniref:SD-repeat containing protein B domain-containing protein n=1 Tax=Fimbriimonas ginsengisoli TaxID=1005039 RepID=A0A931PTI6_FIMGI|nr:hypothetical protein [Fimbriimonas ginsengisoli]
MNIMLCTCHWGRICAPLACLVAFGLTLTSASASVTGAIFTSISDGTTVNGNIYGPPVHPELGCEDVYLNGGPQNLNHAGIGPDGIYYFQVTTPNGALLLSTDPAANRLVRVGKDPITGATGRILGNCDFFGNLGSGGHPNGTYNGSNGSTPVQLWPFDQTTNNGGEYKAWIILARTDNGDGTFTTNPHTTVAEDGVHLNFHLQDTKTDNFKCFHACEGDCNPINAVFSGHKYFDSNLNGVLDPSETAVNGVTIHVIVYAPDGSVFGTCDGISGNDVFGSPGPAGDWSCEIQNIPPNSTYLVCEVPIGGNWLQTGPVADSSGSQCYSGLVVPVVAGLDFGNVDTAKICGAKFYDSNGNGVWDTGELPVSGFQINLGFTLPDGSTATETVTTAADGSWCSKSYPSGTHYAAREVVPPPAPPCGGWSQTAPVGGLWSGDISFPPTYSDDTGTYFKASDSAPDTTGLNFGNVATGRVCGTKFYDKNMNGVKDAGEAPVSGFSINIAWTKPNGSTGTETVVTDSNGNWCSSYYPDGTAYVVTETLTGNWLQTGPAGGSYSGHIGWVAQQSYDVSFCIQDVTGLDFGNIQQARLCGLKFYDTNANGVQDGGEPGIGCFKITITATEPNGSVVTQTLYTNPDGTFCSQLFPDGTTYKVNEVLPVGSWQQTAGIGGYSGTITGGGPPYSVNFTIANVTGLTFGNLKLGAGGGLTLGFWSNKNGQAVMTSIGMSSCLSILNACNLRNANGTIATFSTYSAFKTWLLNATATNMAYMLSAQLATMRLNVLAGYVSSGSLVYAPGCGNTGIGNNYITIGDLLAAAKASLAVNGYTVAPSAIRNYQECLKNALDSANNNLNFVVAPITSVTCGY